MGDQFGNGTGARNPDTEADTVTRAGDGYGVSDTGECGCGFLYGHLNGDGDSLGNDWTPERRHGCGRSWED